jgi:2-polyprenyl-3-methyl-5-hydroxy-6-metoxy-1,4-benzoquinol methylase
MGGTAWYSQSFSRTKVPLMTDYKLLERVCLICGSALIESGRSYTIDELFTLWMPMHEFSQAIIDLHRAANSHTQLHVCENCSLEIFIPPVIGTPCFYEELHSDNDRGYVDDKWDFQEAIKDVSSNGAILDVGCGSGAFLERVKPDVKHAFGIEINTAAVRKAQSKGLVVFQDGEGVREWRGRFDAVFSFHVLEHVRDPIAFMQDLISWTKPGGTIGVSVPNQDGPIKYIDPCIMNMPPHHATRWRRKTFEVLAEKLGLNIHRVAYEPLISRDVYYYSKHFARHMIPAHSRPCLVLQIMASSLIWIGLKSLFLLLGLIGRSSIGSIRGQAMYFAMSKPDTSQNTLEQ